VQAQDREIKRAGRKTRAGGAAPARPPAKSGARGKPPAKRGKR